MIMLVTAFSCWDGLRQLLSIYCKGEGKAKKIQQAQVKENVVSSKRALIQVKENVPLSVVLKSQR